MWIRILCSFYSLLGVHDRHFSWGNVPGCNRNHEVLERKYTVRGVHGHTPLFQVKREFCEIRVTLNICDFLGGGGSNFSLSLPKNSSFLLACAHFVQSAGQHCTWPKREENVSRKSYDLQVSVNRCCVSSTTRDLLAVEPTGDIFPFANRPYRKGVWWHWCRNSPFAQKRK